MLSLDSSVVIDLLRGKRREVRERFSRAQQNGAEIVVSAVALAELTYGAYKAERRVERLKEIDDFFGRWPLAAFSAEDALVSGRLQAEPALAAQPIGAPDLFIAAQALNRGWTIVTSNIKHFGRVEGLPLVDWRTSDEVLDLRTIIARRTGRTED